MQYLAEHSDEFPQAMPEDHTLCRVYRPKLPFKWANDELAQRFAFERVRPAIDSKHFGYHGIFNWPFVMAPDELRERMEIARKIPYVRETALKYIDEIGNVIWQKLPSCN
jgi:hypothetical protein